ncbi:MAG: hypothetical protein JNK66_11105 [Chitinophagales bacterium]|nr:hypothetical protein [Chitinophagales bacterium]
MKIYLLVLCLCVIGITSCTKESAATYKIEYAIGCTDCMVAYTANQNGDQASEFHQSTGWSYTFNAKKNQEVLLMAYNTSSAPQGVTATIKLNGAVLKTRTTYCPISGVSFCVDTIR